MTDRKTIHLDFESITPEGKGLHLLVTGVGPDGTRYQTRFLADAVNDSLRSAAYVTTVYRVGQIYDEVLTPSFRNAVRRYGYIPAPLLDELTQLRLDVHAMATYSQTNPVLEELNRIAVELFRYPLPPLPRRKEHCYGRFSPSSAERSGQ